ncbi:MAG: double zinc ribbon domain-containing protein [Coriobacteriia bacterium]|nr:double zinc ribbon domain-containing protein [Coriobacteriia bacterium]
MNQAIDSFLEMALELVYPTRCVVCERPGAVLCEKDIDSLVMIDHRTACPNCGAPFGRQLCTECMTRVGAEQFAFQEAFSVLQYNKAAEAIVLGYKNGNERRLASEIAMLMAASLPLEWRLWTDAITWVPADRKAFQQRGFDHMAMLAEELSTVLAINAFRTLFKQAKIDQRALTRLLRRANVSSLFSISEEVEAVVDRSINLLLLDDVFTTGATLDSASLVLAEAGFSSIRALTFARVW